MARRKGLEDRNEAAEGFQAERLHIPQRPVRPQADEGNEEVGNVCFGIVGVCRRRLLARTAVVPAGQAFGGDEDGAGQVPLLPAALLLVAQQEHLQRFAARGRLPAHVGPQGDEAGAQGPQAHEDNEEVMVACLSDFLLDARFEGSASPH